MLDRRLIVIDLVQAHQVGIVLLDRYFETLAGRLVLADIFAVLPRANEIVVAAFGFQGQFDVQDDGGHEILRFGGVQQ